jgi:hypothetical protein
MANRSWARRASCNLQGRSAAEDPSQRLFWSEATARRRRSRRGKKPRATVCGEQRAHRFRLMSRDSLASAEKGETNVQWMHARPMAIRADPSQAPRKRFLHSAGKSLDQPLRHVLRALKVTVETAEKARASEVSEPRRSQCNPRSFHADLGTAASQDESSHARFGNRRTPTAFQVPPHLHGKL